jgi:hypothetical protein
VGDVFPGCKGKIRTQALFRIEDDSVVGPEDRGSALLDGQEGLAVEELSSPPAWMCGSAAASLPVG